ncbi:MAG: hypothetical protein VB021_09225 [Oscillospiraceae bacterium]|nr:hypothetical protein [Oscillospiraceae bacterium]
MDAVTQERPQKKKLRAPQVILASALLAASLGICGWLLWVFHQTVFLPHWLSITLCILCAAAMVFCVGFFKAYLSSPQQK